MRSLVKHNIWPSKGSFMTTIKGADSGTLARDAAAGLVVFLVALPLCLGIALASGAPLFSGLLAGIIGGIVVGALSGSQVSVSGPAAGLATVVAAQIVGLQSFEAFLLAVMLAGLMQIGLGLMKAGFLADFVPSSVIKGLLAAIGITIVLKQIPHLVGHDTDPVGEFAFHQPDHENTFSELLTMFGDLHLGTTLIGLLSIAVLIAWDRIHFLKKSLVPAPLIVVGLGIGLSLLFRRVGGAWTVQDAHLVQVPVANSLSEFVGFLRVPDFSQWSNPAVHLSAATIAAIASLETLLNLEAVDRIDPRQRTSPPSRELVAQGVGNFLAGLIGGIPITSVIVRSSVNVMAGSKTKLATVIHGFLLLISVALLPTWINLIPLSCLAAILLVTGIKLASPALVQQMWHDGRYQFIPFAVTVAAIVLTDLLIGVLIGLGVSISFILLSNLRRPLRRYVEKRLSGDVLHIELANQVSFLNRATLTRALESVPRGGHVLLDAQNTDYIDPDILGLIRDFKAKSAPARGVEVSMLGFRSQYHLDDQIQYVDFSTRELQDAATPQQVLQILKDGHERFRTNRRLTRALDRQVAATSVAQHPLAVVLSCIDSRSPAELIFDVGLGDIFSVRVAGNITTPHVLGSIEYACAVANAKLILVLGHTRCGAVTAAVDLLGSTKSAAEATGCEHLACIVDNIQQADVSQELSAGSHLAGGEKVAVVDNLARQSVLRSVELMRSQSSTLDRLVASGRIAVVGAMYDVTTGDIEFLSDVPEPSPHTQIRPFHKRALTGN
jgi:carbonic anhydrase/SulP family sulfate permease